MNEVFFSYSKSLVDKTDFVELKARIQDIATPTIQTVFSQVDRIGISMTPGLGPGEYETVNDVINQYALELDGIYNRSIVQLDSLDSQGRSLMSVDKASGDFNTYVTQNLCINASDWSLAPSSGKIFNVIKAECQFEQNLGISGVTQIHLDYLAWVGLPDPAIVATVTFDSVRALFELGNEHYSSPAIGTEVPHGITTIVYNYPRQLVLHGDPAIGKLASIKVRTSNQTPPSGSYASIGFIVTED